MNFELWVVGMGHCETGKCDNVVIHTDRWSTLLLCSVCFGKCSRYRLTSMGPDIWTLPVLSPHWSISSSQYWACAATCLWCLHRLMLQRWLFGQVVSLFFWEEVMGSLNHLVKLGRRMYGRTGAAADRWMGRWWIEGSMHGWKPRWMDWKMSDTWEIREWKPL